MRFTEHEMTTGLTGAAKTVLAAQSKDVRKGRVDVDQLWDDMDRFARYQVLDALGKEVLPVLVGLPDVEVATGTRPSYSDAEVATTVEALLGDDVGRVRRAAVVKARVALVQAALASMPPRSDPDALIVPDHL